jgi:hypothetical protein
MLNCLLPAAPASAIGIRNDEIEMEILRASSASEFSHSLGHKLTCRAKNATSALPPKADIVCETGHVRNLP